MSDDLTDQIKEIIPEKQSGFYKDHREASEYFKNNISEYTQVLETNQKELENNIIEEIPEEIKLYTKILEEAKQYAKSIPGINLGNDDLEETELQKIRDIERERYNIDKKERDTLESNLKILRHSSQKIVDRFEELLSSYKELKDLDTSNYPPHKTGQKFDAERTLRDNIFNVLDTVLLDSDTQMTKELVDENPVEDILESTLHEGEPVEDELIETYFEEDKERKRELERLYDTELSN